MNTLLSPHILIAWLVLVAMTVISWYLSIDLSVALDQGHRLTTSLLFLLAFFKVRLVIMHFMEVSTAPQPLRIIFEIWVLAICTLLITMYWLLPFAPT